MRSICLILTLLLLAGCVSAIQQKNAQRYTLIAAQAQASGDWDTARRAYARAVVNAGQAGLSPATRALLSYEYGRSLGVTCFFELAESELNLAYELDKEARQPLYLSLVELSRLSFDQGKFDVAASYYSRALIELDKVDAAHVSPAAYADVLNEYSIVLSKLGRVDKASEIMGGLERIRSVNPLRASSTDRTPYGKFCVR